MAPADLQRTVTELLRQQQDTSLQSAVAVFAERQESGTGKYQSLIPLDKPGPGQQYRFEVDLDECTGCKSCVTACHNLNGLDPQETWRKVGTLEQTQPGLFPFSQTVTSACHHCLEPACALGCPVKAYEKDPVTGIVRHLDDQCIGCQYCQMMCPYDVPVYNPRLKIVRKCDMCSSRLDQGEAPACAQACPTDAIRIGIVDQSELSQQTFLPATADPHLTIPSTLYKKRGVMPEGLRAANHFQLAAEASHQPLVWMLIISQAGVGMLLWEVLAVLMNIKLTPWVSPVAVGLVALALGLATLHLGRPLKAWRFMLGLKTSWMSREILAFNLFMLTAAVEFWDQGFQASGWTLGKSFMLITGLLGIYCSCMIYIETRRATWSRFRCFLRFGGTTLLLGLFGVLLVALVEGSTWVHDVAIAVTLFLLVVKCGLEAREHLPLRSGYSLHLRSLLLQWKLLGYWTWTRWMAAWICASALVLALTEVGPPTFIILAAAACLLGEFCERSLFFRSALSRGMPGL
ncbi:MAG TPA: DmsC/YnfH family molybdoenzyme membrane anchor subunit [Oligoflexus sp.]|uniref:DmsC/YnfH family molybdoenzyme membrane anchor subunit n=1 Tax=Oligoflexus sp. TaxID=1971216 RepID=UPI002D23154F|nr:DmsC/YnfH family molybdoenzyme membrane anchor subunit [Oligoflexus sp.]HYX35477.1 DmsC/YnfH family molybdoenzyme membrane anchor subunit [Oligoflexus sp.]